MNINTTEHPLEHIRHIFQEKKQLFSKKRQIVMEILLNHREPLSAYQISELYLKKVNKPIAAMSIYRIIEIFISLGVVHKIHSINKFISCMHISCKHSHDFLVFYICKICRNVFEATVNPQSIHAYLKENLPTGYSISKEPLEIHCICEKCHE